jgi:transcriptional regulator with XRE-family HTH domain
MSQNDEWGRRLTAVIAARVKAARTSRDMSAQQLADATAELGHPIPRSVLANLENGRRDSIGVAEVFALALALDMPPLLLILPIGVDPQVEASPGREVDTWDVARWFMGDTAAPPDLRRPIPSSGPFARLASWPDLAVRLFRTHQQLCDDWSRADDDVQQAVGEDVRSAADRRRGIENYLHEHRAIMGATGLTCLPPLPTRLRVALGDDEGDDEGDDDGQR